MSTYANYSIRQFTIADIDAYKRIRLEALEKEPGMFGNSHAMEAAMPHEDWVNRIVQHGHARFGLHFNDELIGLTAIIIDAENPAEAYIHNRTSAKNIVVKDYLPFYMMHA